MKIKKMVDYIRKAGKSILLCAAFIMLLTGCGIYVEDFGEEQTDTNYEEDTKYNDSIHEVDDEQSYSEEVTYEDEQSYDEEKPYGNAENDDYQSDYGNTEQDYYFRNSNRLDEHYEKHGREMGFDSAESYEEAANAVIHNPSALHKIEAEDGDDVYYVEETNDFVIVSTDGYIRTYFRPDRGIDYYNRQ